MKQRISFERLDFLKDEFPKHCNAFLFGNVIHDWNNDIKKLLLQKAYDALPENGFIIIYDFFMDNERQEKLHSMLMSVYMHIALDGSQFTFKEMR